MTMDVYLRTWAEVRKTYVTHRIEELLRTYSGHPNAGNARQYCKDLAHAEFNHFVKVQQQIAVEMERFGEWVEVE
jgi:hypothetical protein